MHTFSDHLLEDAQLPKLVSLVESTVGLIPLGHYTKVLELLILKRHTLLCRLPGDFAYLNRRQLSMILLKLLQGFMLDRQTVAVEPSNVAG